MNIRTLVLWVAVGTIVAGCASPEGASVAEKRASVAEMRDAVLTQLYQEKPEAKEKIAQAAGYGTFSNVNINLLLVSSGRGYGVVHNNATGQDTYMKMGMVGVGLGAGAKDFRAVMIFKSPEALRMFVEEGWEFGGHADAAAKSGDKGGAANVAGDITSDMEIYQFTEAGIAPKGVQKSP